jgi:hypothetical protein
MARGLVELTAESDTVNKVLCKFEADALAPQHQFGLRFTRASFSRFVAIAVHSLARWLNSPLA